MSLNNIQKAKDVYDVTIKHYPKAPLGYLGMATVSEKQNDIKAAIAFKEKAILVMKNDYRNFPSNKIKEEERELERLRNRIR